MPSRKRLCLTSALGLMILLVAAGFAGRGAGAAAPAEGYWRFERFYMDDASLRVNNRSANILYEFKHDGESVSVEGNIRESLKSAVGRYHLVYDVTWSKMPGILVPEREYEFALTGRPVTYESDGYGDRSIRLTAGFIGLDVGVGYGQEMDGLGFWIEVLKPAVTQTVRIKIRDSYFDSSQTGRVKFRISLGNGLAACYVYAWQAGTPPAAEAQARPTETAPQPPRETAAPIRRPDLSGRWAGYTPTGAEGGMNTFTQAGDRITILHPNGQRSEGTLADGPVLVVPAWGSTGKIDASLTRIRFEGGSMNGWTFVKAPSLSDR